MSESESEVEFKWGKKGGFGKDNREVQFYKSFTYDNVEYFQYDCVYLYVENEPEPYIGKLMRIWEEKKEKKIRVVWFFRPIEIRNYLEGFVEPLKNEIFLAHGRGKGVSNVNPLEVLVGRCNVVCSSMDKRNPQPSEVELLTADFIFYRTFDVGTCKISDKIGDKIGEFEVQLFFNRKPGLEQSSSEAAKGDRKRGLEQSSSEAAKGDKAILKRRKVQTISGDEAKSLMKRKQDKLPKLDIDSTPSASKVNMPFKKSHNVGKLAETLQRSEHSVSRASMLRREGNTNVKQQHIIGSDGDAGRSPKVNPDSSPSDSKVNMPFMKSRNVGNLAETLQRSEHSVTSPSMLRRGDNINVKQQHIIRSDGDAGRSPKVNLDSSPLGSKVNMPFKGSRSVENLAETSQRSEHNVSGASMLMREGSTNVKQLSIIRSDGDAGRSPRPPQSKEFVRQETGLQQKMAPPNQRTNLSIDVGRKIATVKSIRTDDQLAEVTRKQDYVDKSKWFKHKWEDQLQIGFERGTVVLLQNLDPSYSSLDVEDIIRSSFGKSCNAKVIPQTAISSPYSGEAYAIFKSREVADMVIAKLNKMCLMLPNGSPLIAQKGIPRAPQEKPKNIVGHLSLSSIDPQQRQRAAMRDAISTAHFPQPNTLEYPMAMDWLVQQKRTSVHWAALHEKQWVEMEELKSKLVRK